MAYGYRDHDWSQMRPEKKEKVIKAHQEYQARKSRLESLGYLFFQSLFAGSNSTFSWTLNGKSQAYGCDSEFECIIAIEKDLGLWIPPPPRPKKKKKKLM